VDWSGPEAGSGEAGGRQQGGRGQKGQGKQGGSCEGASTSLLWLFGLGGRDGRNFKTRRSCRQAGFMPSAVTGKIHAAAALSTITCLTQEPKRKRYLGTMAVVDERDVDNVRGMLPLRQLIDHPIHSPKLDPWHRVKRGNVARKRRIKVLRLAQAFRQAAASCRTPTSG